MKLIAAVGLWLLVVGVARASPEISTQEYSPVGVWHVEVVGYADHQYSCKMFVREQTFEVDFIYWNNKTYGLEILHSDQRAASGMVNITVDGASVATLPAGEQLHQNGDKPYGQTINVDTNLLQKFKTDLLPKLENGKLLKIDVNGLTIQEALDGFTSVEQNFNNCRWAAVDHPDIANSDRFALPMTFQWLTVDHLSVIQASGEIESNTPAAFEAILAGHSINTHTPHEKRPTIFINSTGGVVGAALEIGRAIRKEYLDTMIGNQVPVSPEALEQVQSGASFLLDTTPDKRGFYPGYCFSACTQMFMGGATRDMVAESVYSVHQFSCGSGVACRNSQQASAEIANYVSDMGVSEKYLTDAARSSNLLNMSRKRLEDYRIIYTPYWYAWTVTSTRPHDPLAALWQKTLGLEFSDRHGSRDDPESYNTTLYLSCDHGQVIADIFGSYQDRNLAKAVTQLTIQTDDLTMAIPGTQSPKETESSNQLFWSFDWPGQLISSLKRTDHLTIWGYPGKALLISADASHHHDLIQGYLFSHCHQ
jgi:hypothetical protein